VKAPTGVPRARDYLHLIARSWWVVAFATALSGLLGWYNWETGSAVYQSTAKLFVTTPGSATTLDAFYGQLNAASQTLTYQYLARSSQVTARTIEQLQLRQTGGGLGSRIVVTSPNTSVLDVTVIGVDPEMTQKTANAVANNMVQVSKELSSVSSSGNQLVLVDAAGPAARQGSWWKSVLGAAALGLALSLVLVLARDLLMDKVLGRRQVGHIVGETRRKGIHEAPTPH
jgi:capsular polysaccharide biosynthesis protein